MTETKKVKTKVKTDAKTEVKKVKADAKAETKTKVKAAVNAKVKAKAEVKTKVIKLNSLKARNGIDSKALGRGIGSGKGKTSTFGHKGGKARSGRGKVVWFEGGQMPLYRRLPKRGFNSMQDKSRINIINLCDLQKLCEAKVLDAKKEVTVDVLKGLGAIKSNTESLRLLAKGELKVALQISVNYASDAAIRAVEAAGGKVQVV